MVRAGRGDAARRAGHRADAPFCKDAVPEGVSRRERRCYRGTDAGSCRAAPADRDRPDSRSEVLTVLSQRSNIVPAGIQEMPLSATDG